MKSHTLPFENRWTNGERAWEWYCELERLGVPNVRTIFAEHETHHQEEPTVIFDVPSGFVRDWLAFHDHRIASHRARAASMARKRHRSGHHRSVGCSGWSAQIAATHLQLKGSLFCRTRLLFQEGWRGSAAIVRGQQVR
jgi:hypothetical protein